MVGNDLLMQFQADLLGVPVIRPKVPETTSLGAAYAAGLATGFWDEIEDLRENWVEDKRWEPTMDAGQARRVLQVLEAGGHPHLRLVRRRRELVGQYTRPNVPFGIGATVSSAVALRSGLRGCRRRPMSRHRRVRILTLPPPAG